VDITIIPAGVMAVAVVPLVDLVGEVDSAVVEEARVAVELPAVGK
jgi:hypothetical protein